MKRVVIGARSRVIDPVETNFLSGATLLQDFDRYIAAFEEADVAIWAWFTFDEHGKPDLAATLRGTEAILPRLIACGRPIILLSTDAVFAGDSVHPYAEVDPVSPQSNYAVIKAAQEQMMAGCAHIVRFTTFGPSFNADRPLLIEMVAKSAVKVDRPNQLFSPVSTVTLNRTLNAIAQECAKPHLFHFTSESVAKTVCIKRIGEELGAVLPPPIEIDEKPLNLSLSSSTHRFPLGTEIERAVFAFKSLRGSVDCWIGGGSPLRY